MKTLWILLLAVTTPAFSQISWTEPPKAPTTVRVEHLDDKDYGELKKLDVARETAMNAYIKARDAYKDKLESLESSHNATPITSCNFSRDVEWKGRYMIVDEFSQAGGCNNSIYVTSPATDLVGHTLQFTGPSTWSPQ
jgi:hypothetical protein